MSKHEEQKQQPGTSLKEVINKRRLLFNLAYRLLGSVADAEDVVQETYLRWYSLSKKQQEEIDSHRAWLAKVASRICLDVLRSARIRRERYVGEWLPEPLPHRLQWNSQSSVDIATDPSDRVTLDESVNMAFLVILESMTPAERVAFILHDVFRYSFAEIAEVIGRSTEACRQLASSARRRIRSAQPPATPADKYTSIVKAFKEAWESGDTNALIGILDPDATAITDGGGLVSAELHPIEGAEQVARFFLNIVNRQPNLTVLERTVNGQPGLVAEADGSTLAVIAIGVANDTIKHIWAVRNPEKLRPWTKSSAEPRTENEPNS